MSITSSDSVWSLGATRVVVGVGATIAVFMQPQQGQIGWYLKFLQGGTLEILPTSFASQSGASGAIGTYPQNIGTTTSLATLAAQSGSGFPLGPVGTTGPSFETLKINGPASFYLSCTGATSIVAALFLKSQGN